MLRETHNRAKAPCRLRTLKVHKFAETNLFQKEKRSQDCGTRREAKLKSEDARPCWS